ncbi:unnamed protein product [Amoebophrya sp. A25]|nr:unnamed protein product [Amoebophrya sp. A25]|eukprot:GSA25T00025826001.1
MSLGFATPSVLALFLGISVCCFYKHAVAVTGATRLSETSRQFSGAKSKGWAPGVSSDGVGWAGPSIKSPRSPARVAVCFSGRFGHSFLRREVLESWRENVLKPLNADVYVATSKEHSGGNMRERSLDIDPQKLRGWFGDRLKGYIIREGGASLRYNLSGFAAIARRSESSQRYSGRDDYGGTMKMLPYFMKIWDCRQLVTHLSGMSSDYEVIIRTRPDLDVLYPMEIHRLHSSTVDGRSGGLFLLSVGPSNVTVGSRDIVVNSFTVACASDWLALGRTSTMLEDMALLPNLIRNYWYRACSEVKQERSLVQAQQKHAQVGGEGYFNTFWQVCGIRVRRLPLGVELSRRKCRSMSCQRQSPYTRLPTFPHARIGHVFGEKKSALDCVRCPRMDSAYDSCIESQYFRSLGVSRRSPCFSDRIASAELASAVRNVQGNYVFSKALSVSGVVPGL